MKVDVQSQGSLAVLTPHGPLTRDEVADFQRAAEAAIEDRHGRVVLDMEQVPYLDSAGIESLLALCTSSAALLKPTFAAICETCRDALDLTNALQRLDVFDTVENALRSYKR